VVRFWSAPPAGVGKVEQVGTATAAGFVNGLAIAPSGRFALAALGTEPRMGRWDRQPDARNVLAVLPLVPSPQSAQQQKP
jgi:ribosomal RNA-processing protein 9